ncbi:MAG: hypothetical protein NTU41_04445 [Chloroflexi bacterium]|nr:hypothetical protein [Chloroflexota bacterium]
MNQEHIKLVYDKDPHRWDASNRVPVALVAPDQSGDFAVEFMLADDASDEQVSQMVEAVKAELKCYLLDKREEDPWAYARYHCSTSANLYSNVHWVLLNERRQMRGPIRGLSVPCFSCGGRTPNFGRYLSVDRLRQVKGAADTGEDIILGGVASLQVCLSCIDRATTESIEFPIAPLPLLAVEREGVHLFARRHADGLAQLGLAAGSMDSCSLCHTAILAGDGYIKVELAEESEQNGIVVKGDEEYTLAIICEECSAKNGVRT